MPSHATLARPTQRLSRARITVALSCAQAEGLPWWAFVRRAGWIATARHVRRLHEIGAMR